MGYAGTAISRARIQLQANVGAAVSGEDQDAADVLAAAATEGGNSAETLFEKILNTDTDEGRRNTKRNGIWRRVERCFGERSSEDDGKRHLGIRKWIHGTEGTGGVFARAGDADRGPVKASAQNSNCTASLNCSHLKARGCTRKALGPNR